MCGIAGTISVADVPQHQSSLAEIERSLKERGPDNFGYQQISGPNVKATFFHSRLSIIDLTKGANQPYEFENLTLTFNGEIYNYVELRQELQQFGYKFETRSDVEVLIKSWHKWGTHCLSKFHGMWAFSIYDKELAKFYIVTDIFGEKPVYIAKDKKRISFSSRIETLKLLSGQKYNVNISKIFQYVVNGYKALHKDTETFFDKVTKLPSRTIAEIDSSLQIKTIQYYNPTQATTDQRSYDSILEQARDILIRNVSRSLRSDVPLSFSLSGGVDSTALLSIAHKYLNLNTQTFTIMNSDGRYDEADAVNKTCSYFGIQNNKITLEKNNFLENLRSQISYNYAPISTISYYTQSQLMKSVSAAGFRVNISGTGADEIYTGYYDHFLLHLASRFDSITDLKKAREEWEKYIRPSTRNPHLQDAELYLKNPSFRDHIYYKSQYYSSFLSNPYQADFHEYTFTDSLLRNRMLNELFFEATPVILQEDDTNSMRRSIENRSPFLSKELLDFMLTVPDHTLISQGYGKKILRDSLQGILPDHIRLERKKIGFNSNLNDVVDLKDKKLREFVLDDSIFYDYFNRTKIETLLSTDLQLNSDSKFLFNIINTKLFLEEFT
jgi:asparagine synthase (glutamine-hydrolysing)